MGGTFGGAGAGALSDLIAIAFPLTAGDGSIPARSGLNQPTVETLLKSQMQDSAGWKSATDIGFAGLPAGIPLFVGMLAKLAEQITGIDVTHWLEQWTDNPVVGTLQGIVQDCLASIFTVQANLQSLFGSMNFLDPDFDPEEAIRAFIQLVLLPTQLLASWAEMFQELTGIGGGSLGDLGSLLGDGLFGRILGGRFGTLPVGQIADASPNTLEDPKFKKPFNVGGYIQDITHGHGDSYSAQVTADGSGQKDLLERNKLEVEQGQTFFVSTWTEWASAAGTGTPLQVGITAYNGDSVVSQPIIAQRAISPATSDPVQLTGTYTVPSGVTHIRLRHTLAPTATSGTIRFSDSELRPTRKMPTGLVFGLNDDLDGLWGGLDAAADALLDKVGLGDFGELTDALSGGLGGAISDIQARLNSFLNPSSSLNGNNIASGNIGDSFIAGILSLRTNIFSGLRRVEPPADTPTHAETLETMDALADGVTGLAARVATLETVYTSGISVGDDFERTATSLGANWLTYYKGGGAGDIRISNGHDAAWQASGFGDREFLSIWNGSPSHSATNNQRVLLPLASAAGAIALLGIYAATDAWLRISDDTTGWANVTGIQVRFWASGLLEIIRWLAGNPTTLTHNSGAEIANPGPGSIIGGEAGKPGTGRFFKAIVGSNGLLEIPEVGTASGFGGAYTRWGWGGLANGNLLPLPAQQKPAAIRQWTAMDQ